MLLSCYYASRKKPASLRHLTRVVCGNKSLNSSQCSIEARPPAEHPDRRAYNIILIQIIQTL